MEHAYKFRTLHGNQGLASLLGEHSMDQVQIDTGHEVCFPTVDAVVVRLFSFALLCLAEVVLVSALLHGAIDLCDPLAS